MTEAEMEPLRRLFTEPTRYQVRVGYVHPNVYAHRAECPDWTLRRNDSHVHDWRCRP